MIKLETSKLELSGTSVDRLIRRSGVTPCARMERAMDLAQMAAREMRINLGGRDVAMAEHLLHRAQVSAALQQMSREAMAQRVRADPTQTRVARGPSLEPLEESLSRHRPAEPAGENRPMWFYRPLGPSPPTYAPALPL